MKRTRLMATVTQKDGAHADYRVYVDDNERLYAKIGGEFVSTTFLFTHGSKVLIWRS